MSFYKDGERIDLTTVRPYDGAGKEIIYQGPDLIKQMLHVAWKEVWKKYFRQGKPVVFHSPKVRSGQQDGGGGYNCPRNVAIQTSMGTANVVWADTAIEKDGSMTYLPTRYDLETRELLRHENDIEEILFMICFNPHFAKDGKLNDMKKTYLRDDVSDAEKTLGGLAESAGVIYLLTSSNSPIFNDEEVIDTLCLAWGVSKPETKEMGIKKLELLNAVTEFSKHNDKLWGYDAFEKAVKDFDSPRIMNLALIQACYDRNGIKLNREQFRWELVGEAGQVQKILVKVPPQDIARAKDILLAHLMQTPGDVEILESLVGGIKLQKTAPKELGFEVPEDVTEVWLTELGWHEINRLYRQVTKDINWKDVKKDQKVAQLKEFFITNKKTLKDLE
jgi:hypothetical protein